MSLETKQKGGAWGDDNPLMKVTVYATNLMYPSLGKDNCHTQGFQWGILHRERVITIRGGVSLLPHGTFYTSEIFFDNMPKTLYFYSQRGAVKKLP